MQKLLLLVGLCVLVEHSEATCSQRMVCTFQSVSNLNTANLNNFIIASHMEPELCTHIIFKSVQPDDNAAMAIPSSGGPIQDRKDFKEAFPSATTKTLLEVDLIGISSAIFTLPKKADFIASVVNVVDDADFDGVNILWKQSGAFDQQAKEGFTLLMQGLKDKLDKRLLTVSVSGELPVIQKSYEVPQLAEVVNFFNVMTEDLDRTFPVGTFQAAIDGMNEWVDKGAPKEKLNMGIATYGVDTGNDANPRIWPKYQVCADVPPPSAMVHIDSDATIDAKARHIVTQEFGGAFVTSLELDDFAGGDCVPGTYPVFRRIKALIQPLCP